MIAPTRPRATGITVVDVRHVSPVTAVQTAAGPTRLREAGLVRRLAASGLPVEVVEVEGPTEDRWAGALGAVAQAFGVADAVALAVRRATAEDRLALVLSGSCHLGLGSLAGIPGEARGVVWLDAHGDFNTPDTTGSGLVDGTVLAAMTGRGWSELARRVAGFRPVADERVVLLGARGLDEGERELLEASAVTLLPAGEATTRGPAVFGALGRDTDGVYLHVDLDVLDARVGRANVWAEEGGLGEEALHGVAEEVVARCPVRAVGFASYDPDEDEDGAVCRVALELAARIAAAA